MPARKRSAEEKRAAEPPKRTKAGKRSGKKPAAKGPKSLPDPSDHPDSVTRFIQPYEAVKSYLCPGCNREIPAGVGHLVAVPPEGTDLRRHWHRGCWAGRAQRR